MKRESLMYAKAIVSALLVYTSSMAEDKQTRTLFDFAGNNAAAQWNTVNDGVMGGRSDGRFKISNLQTMQFFGRLSLENNGGFASVRSRPQELGLGGHDHLITRVKGDGRRYTLNLYVPARRMAYSYRVSFDTRKDQWIELRVPLSKFVATSFGRRVRNAGPVDPARVNSIGFLLGDKKPGPFKLEIDWIRAGRKKDISPSQESL